MDPLTLILAALAAGAAAGAQDTAGEAVKEAYQGLKGLLQRRFSDNRDAERALLKHESKPQVWEAPLREELAQIAADRDEEVVEAAQRLMTLVQPQQIGTGNKFNIQMGSVQGSVVGDHANVDMTFHDKQPEK